MTAPLTDPFTGSDSVPSLSFKDAPIGTVHEGTIVESAVWVHSRNFDTGLPDYWPTKAGETPSPKMAAVIKIALTNGEEAAIWAIKPSALYAAINDAAKHAGRQIEIGGTLAVKYTGDKPNIDTRKFAAKQYAARYTPPAATADPFAAAPTAPVAQDAKGWDASPPF